MGRPLGCLTGSALITATLATLALLGVAAATGNGIFSPGELSGVERDGPVGGVASHAELDGRCDACHTAIWSGETMSQRCLACHTEVGREVASDDGLHGRLSSGGDCRDCHTDHRGLSASLTVVDPGRFPHDRTGYSLQAHSALDAADGAACLGCHPDSLSEFSAPTCVDCHERADPPYTAEHVAAFGGACLGCHDGVDSYGAAFDHPTYPLDGGHARPGCIGCHRGATTLAALGATPTDCVACHAGDDIHAGRLGTSCVDCHTPNGWDDASLDHDRTRFPLVARHLDVTCTACHVDRQWTGIGLTCRACHGPIDPHAGQFAGDCAECHVASGWEDVTFSHASTGFALADAHAEPACAACHPAGRYVGTPTTCIGCHAADDRHDGGFGTNCGACHPATTWGDWTFDHDLSSFPLTGAHRGASCQGCHDNGRFEGTPTACASCHANPASHTSAFGTLCNACHSTVAWRPASFDAPHPFPMNHGDAGGTCATCHPASFATNSCTGCHEHSPAIMNEHHKEVPGYALGDCLRCHPRGTNED